MTLNHKYTHSWGRKKIPLEVKLERALWRTTPGPGGCMISKSAGNSWGYPQIRHEGKFHVASRLLLERRLGRRLKKNKFALHTCDNSGCLNPDHLYEGSLSDNARDRKNRGARGFKLNKKWASIIRELPGLDTDIARVFNVSPSLICQIKKGIVWNDS